MLFNSDEFHITGILVYNCVLQDSPADDYDDKSKGIHCTLCGICLIIPNEPQKIHCVIFVHLKLTSVA